MQVSLLVWLLYSSRKKRIAWDEVISGITEVYMETQYLHIITSFSL